MIAKTHSRIQHKKTKPSCKIKNKILGFNLRESDEQTNKSGKRSLKVEL